jgi:hypothetical protein
MRRAGPAALLLFALTGTGAVAQAPDVACKVDGYDVVLSHSGTKPLPEGSALAWSVPFARSEGVHVLERALAPGRVVVLTGALGSSYLTSATECFVTLQ